MKPIKIMTLLLSVQLFGTVILENIGVDVAKIPLFNISLIEAAHAGRPARHHTGHRTSRGHSRTSVDVNRSGSRGSRSVNVDVDHHHGPRLGAVAAGIAIGTRVARLPSGCTTVLTYGVTYHHCGGVYYRPYYQGTTVVYVVTDTP